MRKGDFTILATRTAVWLDGGGSELMRVAYVEGNPVPAYVGKTPTKAPTELHAYAFAGWDEGTAEDGVTIYRPTFDEKARTYAVTFIDFDGTVLAGPTEYEYGTPASQVELPDDPTREDDA